MNENSIIDDAIQELTDPDDELVEQLMDNRLVASEDAVSLNEDPPEEAVDEEAPPGFTVPVDIPTGEDFHNVKQVEQMYMNTSTKNINILWKNLDSLICGLAMTAGYFTSTALNPRSPKNSCLTSCLRRTYQREFLITRLQQHHQVEHFVICLASAATDAVNLIKVSLMQPSLIQSLQRRKQHLKDRHLQSL